MATLFNTKIKDTYQSLLKLEDNTILTTTSKNITDGLGNASPLYLSTTQVRIGSNSASAMYWDDTNNRLGIGTSSPISKLQVNGTILSGSGSGDTFSSMGSAIGNYGGVGSNYYTIGNTYYRTYTDSVSQLYFNAGGFQFRNAVGGSANSAIGFNSQMEVGVGGGGYLTLGTNISGTINGAKFGILSNGSTSGTKAMIILNSSYDQIFQIQDDGSSTFGRGGSNSLASFYGLTGLQCVIGNDSIQTPSNIYRTTNGQLTFYGRNNNANAFSFEHNNSQQSNASGVSMINIGGGYSTQSDAQFSSLQIVPSYDLNANTTTNSIARGIYYNPTITNLRVAQHRAIETVTGDVLFGTTSGKVGIGTSAPTSKLHVSGGDITIQSGNKIQNESLQGLYLTGGSGEFRFINGGGGGWWYTWYQQNAERMRLNTSNQLCINNTTGGGMLTIQGSGSTSATTSLLVQNSGATNLLQMRDDGQLFIGTTASGLGKILVPHDSVYGDRAFLSIQGGTDLLSTRSNALLLINGGSFWAPDLQLTSLNAGLRGRTAVQTSNSSVLLSTEINAYNGTSQNDACNLVYIENRNATLQAGGSINWIKMDGVVNEAGGGGNKWCTGIYYNPTLTGGSLLANSHYCYHATSGQMMVNTTSPQASAQLQVDSTTRGVLFPRMTTTQKNLISAVAGLVVYDTTTNKLCCYNGSTWNDLF